MKLQIDTTAKTIRVEGTVNLKDLYDALEKLLPRKEWEFFSLEANTTIVWTNPITIIEPYRYLYPQQPYWYSSPIVTCDTSGGYTLNSGVYNIQT